MPSTASFGRAASFTITAVAFALLGCSGGTETKSGDTSANGAASVDHSNAAPAGATGADERLPFKLGLMTGTVSQGEDEYRGAERVVAKYGADRIRHVTYPDNFMNEQETMIAQIVNLASDPEVKAIIVAQAVPGSIAAMKRVKELRPDMLFLLDNPHEDPRQVVQYADVCVIPDELRRGDTILELAAKMGAKTFVHYSFPRHMSQELLSRRKDIMERRATSLGLRFLHVNAPDPMGDQGLPGSQRFILEDVPRQVAQHGKDTAFFSTNCGMQEPLIRAALDAGAIFPEQCCPSPTHGYPGALGIAIPEGQAGNMAAVRAAIKEKVVAAGETGRMATWPESVGIVSIVALCELGIQAVKGETKVADPVAVKREFDKAAGVDVALVPLEDTTNYYMFLEESVIF
jgi:hypothetical protein